MLPVIDGRNDVDKPAHFQWFAGFIFLLACESVGFVFKEISALKVMVSIGILSLLVAELPRKSYMVFNNSNTA